MVNKIKSYIDHLFNINKINDEEMKEEITSNVIDRYIDLIDEGFSEEKAYLESIKSIGDLNVEDVDVEVRYHYKPNWANISLFVSLGFAVLATLFLLIHGVVSILFISASILLHIASSHYLYHYSQYVMKEEKDVDKHNELLRSIFRNLKTIFIFWNINITYWITQLIMTFLTPILVGVTMSNIIDEGLELSSFIGLIFTAIVIFAIIFIIIYMLLNSVYKLLETKYVKLTGDKNLEKYSFSTGTFNREEYEKTIKYIRPLVYFILIILVYAINITYGIKRGDLMPYSIGYKYNSNIILGNNLFTVIGSISLVSSLVFLVVSIFYKKKKELFNLIVLSLILIADLSLYIILIFTIIEIKTKYPVYSLSYFKNIFFILKTIFIIIIWQKNLRNVIKSKKINDNKELF